MADDTPPAATNATVASRYEEYVMPIWKHLQVPLRRAHGCTLEDLEGNEYLDAFSGISVTNVGHTDGAVVEAARDQLGRLVHGCSYLHPNEPVADLAARLAEITPGDLRKSFFCNSGTEAIEGAIKLARKYTGHAEIVALEMAFHGRTLGSLALTGNHAYKHGMAPTLNDVVHAPAPYRYRSPDRDLDEEAFAARCAGSLERVIRTHTSTDLAAVVLEPVMGEGGIVVPPRGYLERVAEVAHDYGGLLVLDEVQTGYGRTGAMYASEHEGVVPDVLAHAKGIANGLPLGAFTAPDEIADAFEPGDHLSTFGGNPVCCAAALATIDRLEDGLIGEAAEHGRWLVDRLEGLRNRFEVVGDVRGRGLMWGVEVVDPEAGPTSGPNGVAPAPDAGRARRIGEAMGQRGIVIGVGGFYGNVLRIQPPLVIDREGLERTVDGLEAAIASVADGDGAGEAHA